MDPYAPPARAGERPWIQTPAVALLVTGVLDGLAALYFLLAGTLQLVRGVSPSDVPSEYERAGYVAGQYGALVAFLVFGLAGLACAPVIVYGAVQMMRHGNLRAARRAALLAIVPATSCCCVAGIPIGLWARSVLARDEVAGSFEACAVPGRPDSGV